MHQPVSVRRSSVLRFVVGFPRPFARQLALRAPAFWTLVVACLCLAPAVVAQDVSMQPPADYERHLAPLLLDVGELVKQARPVAERVRDGEQGSVLLAEKLTRVSDDGSLLHVQHDVYRANTDDMVDAVARAVVRFRRGEQRVHVALARTLLDDGTSVPVRPLGIFVQTPQNRADDALYSADAELVILFPQVSAGALVEFVAVIEEDEFRIRGQFTDLHIYQYYWPADVLRRVVDLPHSLATRLRITGVGEQVPQVRRESSSGRTRFTWRRDDAPSYEPKAWSPPLEEIGPTVWLTTLESWENVADWYRSLLQGRDALTSELQVMADEWTAGLDAPVDIVRSLHQRVADDVRYTGLEFGIAGFQPKLGAEVWHDRFGDCKDKANLLRALLAHKGIRSHMVLLDTEHAGQVETRSPDFRHFDHAILAVELEPDSRRFLWADPTIAYLPAGTLGDADRDRDVLVVRDDGYLFARTPKQRSDLHDANFDLEVAPDGVAGWVRLHVTGASSAAYRSYFADDELWQRRGSVETYLSDWFPGAEVMDVELTLGDTATGEASFQLRAYFLQRDEALAGDGPRSLLLPDFWHRSVMDSLEEDGPGEAFLQRERSDVRVRYRLPAGWTARYGRRQPFSVRVPSAEMAASWSCEESQCRGEVSYEQVASRLGAAERATLAKQVAALATWIEDGPRAVPPAGNQIPTLEAEAPSDAAPSSKGEASAKAATELSDFPVLSSAAGQLLLVDRRFPADRAPAARRAALEKVIQWFPGESDRAAVFEARFWLADLDCDAQRPEGGEAMRKLLAQAGTGIPAETVAWGRYLRGMCPSVQPAERQRLLRSLAEDGSLSPFRRFWSAYQLAHQLDEVGERQGALEALALAPEDVDAEKLAEKAVLETWIRGRTEDAELPSRYAEYLQGERAPAVAARLVEAIQFWESNGEKDLAGRSFAALMPSLEGRDELADLVSTLRGLGLSAADGEKRRTAANRLAALLGSERVPDWWHRITVEDAAEEALAARTKELGETELVAEYLRHLGELVMRYPSREGFSQNLWRFAAVFDHSFPDEPLGADLVDSVLLLSSDDAYHHEGQILRIQRIERLDGGEAAIEATEALLADPSLATRLRVSLQFRQGQILERMGRPEEALASYAVLIPLRDGWTHAIDADLRRALIYVELDRFDEALAVAAGLADVSEENVELAGSPEQIRSLVRMASEPAAAKDYWRQNDDWFGSWRRLAADLGWTPGAPLEVPDLGDERTLGQTIGLAIQSGDAEGYLESSDALLRGARIHPRLLADAGFLLERGMSLAPGREADLRDLGVELLAMAPEPGSAFDVERLAQRCSLLRAGYLVDSGRTAEAATEIERFFGFAPPEGDLYRRMLVVNGFQAQATQSGLAEAAELLATALVPEWTDSSRGQAVGKLSDLYRDLGRTDDEVDLLERELEVPATRDSPYAADLRKRLESRRATTSGLAEVEQALRDWLRDEAPGWVDYARPHDLSDEPWSDKPVAEWLEEDEETSTELLKLAVLAGLSDDLPAEVRLNAVAELPRLLYFVEGWHRGRGAERLGSWRDETGWPERLHRNATLWLALTTNDPEQDERVEADPMFQDRAEDFHRMARRTWHLRDVSRGPVEAQAREIESMLGEEVLDERGAAQLASLIFSLATQTNPGRASAYLEDLRKVRVAGDVHGGERLHLDLSRRLREMQKDQGLHDAVRAYLAETGRLASTTEPPDLWWDLVGFDVTGSILPAAEAEKHFQFQLASQFVARDFVSESLYHYPALDDGTEAWSDDYFDLLGTVLLHLVDDETRAGLARNAMAWMLRRPAALERLAAVLEPFRADPGAVETRAILGAAELKRAAMEGRDMEWKREVEKASPGFGRDVTRSMWIHRLAAQGDTEALKRILHDLPVDRLLEGGGLDDHLLLARQTNDADALELLGRVARDEIYQRVLSSWATPSWADVEWALTVAERLGASDQIPEAWVRHQRETLGNELMKIRLELFVARLHGDWQAAGQAAEQLQRVWPDHVDLAWDLARAAHRAGDDAAAADHLASFLGTAHDHWQYREAVALCRQLGCKPPAAVAKDAS